MNEIPKLEPLNKNDLKVVETLFVSNQHDVPGSLRRLADNIEEGQYGEVGHLCVVFRNTEEDNLEVFGFGGRPSQADIVFLLQQASQKLIQWGLDGMKVIVGAGTPPKDAAERRSLSDD